LSERKKERLCMQQDAPSINEGEGDTKGKDRLVGIWRVAGSPLLQTKALRVVVSSHLIKHLKIECLVISSIF